MYYESSSYESFPVEPPSDSGDSELREGLRNDDQNLTHVVAARIVKEGRSRSVISLLNISV